MTGSPHRQRSPPPCGDARPRTQRLPSFSGLDHREFAPPAAKTAPIASLSNSGPAGVNRTSPLGQMQISGSPISFGPCLSASRSTSSELRTEIYAVDVTIDGACHVLAASTHLESNEWPSGEVRLPIATVVLAILAVWYVAAALMNAPLQRDLFANARPDGLFHPGPRRRFAQHGAAETAGPASGRERTLQARLRNRADLEAQPRLSWA